MRSLVGGVILLVAAAGWASADGYKDFNSGVAAADRYETDDAIKLLSSALAQADLPAHLRPVAFLSRGRQYIEANRYDAGIADFTSAIQLKPDYVDAYLSRCRAKARQGHYPEAIADCSDAIRLQPDNFVLRDVRATLYVQAKRLDEAIAEYSALVAARPKDDEFNFGLIDALRDAERFDDALAAAKTLSDMAPRWAKPYTKMGQIYVSKRDLKRALDSFETAIDRGADDAIWYLYKGQVQWALGRYDDASDSLRDALKRDNLQRYAFLWLAMSRSREAAAIPPDIVKRFSDANLDAFSGQLVSLYLGRPVNVADLLKTKGVDPDSDETYECSADFFVGEWYQINGNSPEAKRLLQATAQTCSANGNNAWLAKLDLGRLP
jgi:tetratricopeptide (TPR) repeat protein